MDLLKVPVRDLPTKYRKKQQQQEEEEEEEEPKNSKNVVCSSKAM